MPITKTYFSPTSIGGCQLWIDAADANGYLLSGSTVTKLNDKSGNNNSSTSSTGTVTYQAKGLNGLPAFSLNATGGFRGPITISSTNITAFVVATINAGVNYNGRLLGLATPTLNDYENATTCEPFFSLFTGPNIGGYRNGYLSQTTGGSYDTPFLGKSIFTGASNIVTINERQGTSVATSGPLSISQYGFGCEAKDNAGVNWYGMVSEMIVYNSLLSDPQQTQIQTYLKQKWFMGGSTTLTKTPYYKAFTPLSINTCALWLDAADSTTITGTNPITAWTDKSGTGRPVTITSGPTYGSTTQNGNKTLVFSNNQITTSIASAVGTGDFTLVAVWKQVSAGTNTVLSLGTSQSSSQSLGFSANKYNFYQYGSLESAYTASAGTWVAQVGTRISSVKTLYVNGNVGTTPATDSYNQTVTTVTIGKGDTFAISGEVGEIMIYTGTMSTDDKELLESYLTQKWGLTTYLPSSHRNFKKPAGLPAAVPSVILLFTTLSSFMSTVYNLSGTYALANIANAVTSLSATPAYIWTVAVPSGAKGKNGILAIFFNMYSVTQFTANQYFDYGVYVDGVAQMLGDSSGTIRYVQTAGGNYAMSSGGISLGVNGLINGFPLILPLSFLTSASQIQIGIKNSFSAMSPVSSSGPAYTSNVLTSTGTGATLIPQNTFTTTGSNTYTLPANTSAGVPIGIYVYLWGGGGGYYGGGGGGSGGYTSGFYACSPGTVFTTIVAAVPPASGLGTFSNGGGAGTGYTGGGAGGGGGGFSAIFLGTSPAVSNLIALAGGGGGGSFSNSGGGGGGSNGGYGYLNDTGAYITGVRPGTQTAGGINTSYTSATSPGQWYGGTTPNGGGGGGFYGGAGGANVGNGGAGGSGFTSNLTSGAVTTTGSTYTGPTNPTVATLSNVLPPNTSSPYYVTGYGHGALGTGLVVIVPAIGTNPVQIGVAATLYSG